MRNTTQRKEILEFLRSKRHHCSAIQVYDAVREKIPNISLGTVYRNLGQLIETGDIISVIVYDAKENNTFTPDELRYVRVVTSTTSKGLDKAEVTDHSQPVTVTLIVNQEQAELLAKYEKTSSMHFTLEYRGDEATAQMYLEEQASYFEGR